MGRLLFLWRAARTDDVELPANRALLRAGLDGGAFCKTRWRCSESDCEMVTAITEACVRAPDARKSDVADGNAQHDSGRSPDPAGTRQRRMPKRLSLPRRNIIERSFDSLTA